MKVDYKLGKISFDLHDILRYVEADQKIEMVESLACDDDIIRHIADQIITGWTENWYHGGTACTVQPSPTTGLDWACREVAKHSGEVAAKEIARLEEALQYEKVRYTELMNEYQDLRNRSNKIY